MPHFHILQHLFRLKSSSMREGLVHLVWISTHFIRTFVGKDSSLALYSDLAAEVKILQSELHRAHRLIEGYNLILARDDSGLRTQLLATQVFTVVIVALTAILWYLWFYKKPVTSTSAPVLALGNTNSSSSDSDQPQPGPLPLEAKVSGPFRPSSLGRVKRRL